MIDNIRDSAGNQYYRKYTSNISSSLSIEIAYEKISELIEYLNYREADMVSMKIVVGKLENEVIELNKEREILRKLKQ